jgi:hypothetical protein
VASGPGRILVSSIFEGLSGILLKSIADYSSFSDFIFIRWVIFAGLNLVALLRYEYWSRCDVVVLKFSCGGVAPRTAPSCRSFTDFVLVFLSA